MNKDPAAALFGTIGAIVVCGGGAFYLRSKVDEWGLPTLAVVCLSIVAFCLIVGWTLDRRTSGQEARGKYVPPSGE